MVRVHSTMGETRLRARLTGDVPEDHLVMYEAWFGEIGTTARNWWMRKALTWAPGKPARLVLPFMTSSPTWPKYKRKTP